MRFANGTRKLCSPDGAAAGFFTIGDVKRTSPPSGGGPPRVEYYYAEVDTWHTTHPTGVEVYHFPSGQVEAHFSDGSKEILFPDGYMRRVFADGREEDLNPEED